MRRCSVLDHVLLLDSRTGSRSLHRVVPLPHCAVCGGATAAAPLERTAPLTAATPLDRVVRRLAGWLDGHTGVIGGVVPEPNVDPQARLPVVMTTAPPTIAEDEGSLRTLPVGWGKGLTVSGALLSAVGEAVERYAASLPDPARLTWKRADELPGRVSGPAHAAALFQSPVHREGFAYVPYRRRVRHPWIRGVWFGTKEPVWVPAMFVFLSLTIEPEHLLCQGTSNGLAAAGDFDDAATRATLELIERDAMLASWLTSRPGQRITLDATCDRRLLGIVAAIESLGATVETYLLTAGAYGATVLCLGLGDGKQYPGVTIGLGAGVDARAALKSAVLELGQTGPYLQRTMLARTIPVPRGPASVRTMLDHAAYYFPRRRAEVFDRIRNGGAPVSMRELPRCRPLKPMQHCADALKAAGIRVAVVDVTSRDAATGPFRVVRAVSPDLQPISYGAGMDRMPVDRVRAMGLSVPFPPIQPVW